MGSFHRKGNMDEELPLMFSHYAIPRRNVHLTAHCPTETGFRNRLAVTMNWAWNYVTFQRGTRLITGMTGSKMENVNRSEGESLQVRLRQTI